MISAFHSPSALSKRKLKSTSSLTCFIVILSAEMQPVSRDVIRTPRMKEILNQTYPSVIKLREYAGYTGSRSRKNRMDS